MYLPNEVWELVLSKLIWIDDLINCSKVCQTWNYIVKRRLVNVKYLFSFQLGDESDDNQEPTSIQNDLLFYRELGPVNTTIIDYVQLLENLEVIEIHDHGMTTESMVRDIFRLKPRLKGLWFGYPLWFPLGKYIEDIDMLTIMGIGGAMDDLIEYCSPTLRQLHLETARDILMDIIAEFSALERLHIEEFVGDPLYMYDGPAIQSLEILELMVFDDDHSDPSAFGSLIDYCPNLKSLYISFESVSTFIYDPHIINRNLENLVIEYLGNTKETRESLYRFLKKFPNLKNLGIHGTSKLNNLAVEKFLSSWKNIEILDLRGCQGITEESKELIKSFSTNELQYFCGDYSDYNIRSDVKILCHGFDFMKNVFFKSFKNIPVFMIPIDEDEEKKRDDFVFYDSSSDDSCLKIK